MSTLNPVLVTWRLVSGQLVAPGRTWVAPAVPPVNPGPPASPWFFLDDPGSVLDGPRKLA